MQHRVSFLSSDCLSLDIRIVRYGILGKQYQWLHSVAQSVPFRKGICIIFLCFSFLFFNAPAKHQVTGLSRSDYEVTWCGGDSWQNVNELTTVGSERKLESRQDGCRKQSLERNLNVQLGIWWQCVFNLWSSKTEPMLCCDLENLIATWRRTTTKLLCSF